MGIQRSCDICKFYRQRADGSPAVLRYQLQRSHSEPPGQITGYTVTRGERAADGRIRSYGCGSIDLCDECWTNIAKPRMRKAAA